MVSLNERNQPVSTWLYDTMKQVLFREMHVIESKTAETSSKTMLPHVPQVSLLKISQRPLFLKQIATARFMNRRPIFQGLERLVADFHSSQLKWRGSAPSTCACSFVTLVNHVNPRRVYTTHLPSRLLFFRHKLQLALYLYSVADITAVFYIKLASRSIPEHIDHIKSWGGSITCPSNEPLWWRGWILHACSNELSLSVLKKEKERESHIIWFKSHAFPALGNSTTPQPFDILYALWNTTSVASFNWRILGSLWRAVCWIRFWWSFSSCTWGLSSRDLYWFHTSG